MNFLDATGCDIIARMINNRMGNFAEMVFLALEGMNVA